MSDAVLAISKLDDEAIGEDEEKRAIVDKLNEIREGMKTELEEARGETPPEGMEEWPEIDPMSLNPTVPDEFLWKQLIKELRHNDCRNRGYVLDGFPRIYKGAQNIFMKWKPQFDEEGEPIEEPEREEGEEKNFSLYIADETIIP